MKVYFYDKDSLKKELKNKNIKKITVRFKTHKSIELPLEVLNFIRNIAKNDRTFMKKLLASETNFIYFLSNLIKK
jgi:hypothetical protein